jgi:hypothetical protein
MPVPVTPQIITIYKNATGDVGVLKSVTVLNSDNLTPKDITGLTMLLKVWDGDPAQPLLSSTNVANDGNPTDGVVNWTVSSADMTALPVNPDGLKVNIRFYTGATYQDTSDAFTLRVLPAA